MSFDNLTKAQPEQAIRVPYSDRVTENVEQTLNHAEKALSTLKEEIAATRDHLAALQRDEQRLVVFVESLQKTLKADDAARNPTKATAPKNKAAR